MDTQNTHQNPQTQSPSTDLVRSAKTESAIERFKSKLSARKATGIGCVAILDTSYSMSAPLPTGQSRIAGLREVVTNLRDKFSFQQITFASDAQFSDVIPEAHGGTSMKAALMLAHTVKPRNLIVVSDGSPTDASEDEILLYCREMLPGVVIDTFFIGDPDSPGEVFMRRLSQATGGRHGVTSDMKSLSQGIILALTDGQSSAPTASGPIAL